MDRTGESWSGDDVADAAAGASATEQRRGNRADDRPSDSEAAPRARSVDTAAADSATMNEGGAPAASSSGSAD